jgi:hypothetical protein
MKNHEELYLEEVNELTNLLKTEWLEIKNKLLGNNVNINSAYLFGYYEDEKEGSEVGLIYTKENEFQRFMIKDNRIEIKNVDKNKIKKEFPQVIVFEKMGIK